MNEVTTIGLDLAKNVFQIHGVDASGETVICRRLRRCQVIPFFSKLSPCLIGVEGTVRLKFWPFFRSPNGCGKSPISAWFMGSRESQFQPDRR